MNQEIGIITTDALAQRVKQLTRAVRRYEQSMPLFAQR